MIDDISCVLAWSRSKLINFLMRITSSANWFLSRNLCRSIALLISSSSILPTMSAIAAAIRYLTGQQKSHKNFSFTSYKREWETKNDQNFLQADRLPSIDCPSLDVHRNYTPHSSSLPHHASHLVARPLNGFRQKKNYKFSRFINSLKKALTWWERSEQKENRHSINNSWN